MYLQKYRRDLLLPLIKRDFFLRNKRSGLGVLWSLPVPLAQLLVLAFIFGKVVHLNWELTKARCPIEG